MLQGDHLCLELTYKSVRCKSAFVPRIDLSKGGLNWVNLGKYFPAQTSQGCAVYLAPIIT